MRYMCKFSIGPAGGSSPKQNEIGGTGDLCRLKEPMGGVMRYVDGGPHEKYLFLCGWEWVQIPSIYTRKVGRDTVLGVGEPNPMT